MNTTNITKEFVLEEVKKLQYLYGLKTEIRYAQTRNDSGLTESVAEHVYGMSILAMYFLPLVDPEEKLDRTKIYETILLHDIDEVETGDSLGYLKTEAMRLEEEKAAERVIVKSPLHMQNRMSMINSFYALQTGAEERFVKAIDRFEPLIQGYGHFGKTLYQKNKTTFEHSQIIKEDYLKPYPLMYVYYEIIHKAMVDEGFFYEPE